MMTMNHINKLPECERAVTRASYHYYRALLSGVPDATKEQLRQLWLLELRRRWPTTWQNN